MIEVSLKMHHPYFVHATNIYFLCILLVYFFYLTQKSQTLKVTAILPQKTTYIYFCVYSYTEYIYSRRHNRFRKEKTILMMALAKKVVTHPKKAILCQDNNNILL